jgi:hypothetical protein
VTEPEPNELRRKGGVESGRLGRDPPTLLR